MAKSIEIVKPGVNEVLPIEVLTDGIKWKWQDDPYLYVGNSPPGFEFITPNEGIPHRYIGKIKMIIRDSSGGEVYSYTYDCGNPNDGIPMGYAYNNQGQTLPSPPEPEMKIWGMTGCISAPSVSSIGGQAFGSMNYWDPPKDKFKAGEKYYIQGEVETIAEFEDGSEACGGGWMDMEYYDCENFDWCKSGSECVDGQCSDGDSCVTGKLTDVLYNNSEGNTYGIPFEIEVEIPGCMDSEDENYNSEANKDDGSCEKKEKVEAETTPYPQANQDSNEDEDDGASDEVATSAPDEEIQTPETPISSTPISGDVSNRMFGADMTLAVKRKLEARQFLNSSNRNPNDPVTTMYKSDQMSDQAEAYSLNDPALGLNLQFGGDADLSSRTPFARLWTAVQIQNVINKRSWHKNEDKNYGKDKKKYRYETRNNRVYEKEIHRHERMVYMVGDANSNILDRSPTQTRDLQDEGAGVGGDIASKLLPYEGESNNNQYFKPPAGITSVSSESEGPLGAVRKTSVEFTVHNFHDFENIYSRYFLRPGAMVYIDFGWSSTPLYDPKELVYDDYGNQQELEKKLYGPDGVVTKSAGDLECFMGYVIDYSAKATENGSFECSVEIVSKNQALLGHSYKGSKSRKNKIIATLDSSIINFAAKHFGDGFLKENKSYDAKTHEELNQIAFLWASEQLDGSHQPYSKEHRLTGVFWKTLKQKDEESGKMVETPGDSKNIYISWGLFEDFILNNEFAIATDPDDALHGQNLTVRFDSSNSYVHWDTNLHRMQREDRATPFKFLYPSRWERSYNTVRGKVPFDRLNDKGRYSKYAPESYGTVGTNKNRKLWHVVDKQEYTRIPVREIFVSLSLVKEGLEKKDKIKDILTYILDGINEESKGIYDLQISSNKTHMAESSIVDRNYVYAEKMDKYSYLDKLFVFQPHSENSIVTDFSVNFTMPSNDMNSMIAIQGADAGTQIFPVDSSVDRVLAMNIQKYIGEDASMGIAYLPEVGNHRIEKIQDSLSSGQIVDAGFFDVSEALLGEDGNQRDYLSNFRLSRKDGDKWEDVHDAFQKAEETEEKESEDDETTSTEVAAKEKEEYDDDVQLAGTLADFYALKAKSNYFTEQMSTVIPIEVELSIYGIGSINVGDIFRVDYLPKIYRDTVYFQTTKVSHDLDSSGWVTKLTTQMRISPAAKQEFPLYLKPKIFLSRNIVAEYNLVFDGGKYWNKKSIGSDGDPKPFMRDIELLRKGTAPKYQAGGNQIKVQFKFVATKNATITKQPFMLHAHPAVRGAMPWQIIEDYPRVSWKLSGKDSFKMWQEKVPNSAMASGAFGVWNNYGLFFKLKLKAGNEYKLIVAKSGAYVIVPYDFTDDQIDLINQGFWALGRGTNSKGDYNIPRPSLAARISE